MKKNAQICKIQKSFVGNDFFQFMHRQSKKRTTRKRKRCGIYQQVKGKKMQHAHTLDAKWCARLRARKCLFLQILLW